jgi:hypothetical protein
MGKLTKISATAVAGAVLVGALAFTGSCGAADHPTQAPGPKPAPLTKDGLAAAITAYVQKDTQLKGGYFLFYDAADSEILALRLDQVHEDRVAHTGGEVYFACADLKRTLLTPEAAARFEKQKGDEVMYDLDFWLKRDEHGALRVTQIMVHEVAGKPRYEWHEEGGVWKQRQPTKAEDPEHPH